VAVVVYAGASGVVLPPTSCSDKARILAALDELTAGGSTHGSAGIQLAYRVAREGFLPGGNNRVILATDGDFNVGTTSQGELVRLIEEKAAGSVYLTVLGFGMGNYKDATLEKLADKGNGNYAYIDTRAEARKVFVHQIGATLVTIAKDVKIQVEFNPARARAYRLIGYENRLLAKEDFRDDTKDAGEIGAGHSVTALYEVVPASVPLELPRVDPLKYQEPAPAPAGAGSDELMTVKLRYKQPEGVAASIPMEHPVVDRGQALRASSPGFRFAASVAAFGMLLRDSEYKGEATWGMVRDLAASARGRDPHGYRAEFERLVTLAEKLARAKSP
jgi:Ca-activated chloride channel family protein